MKRGRKTDQEWREIHAAAIEYVNSGSGSAPQFCAEQEVNTDSLYSACSRLKMPWPTLRKRAKRTTGTFQKFVPVTAATNGHHAKMISLNYGAIKILVESDDVEGLRSVLETLKQQGGN